MSSNVAEQKVCVLRLGHRAARDKRVTTHLFLTARAFGADKVIYTGQRDKRVEETVRKVATAWGGAFKVEHEADWKKTVKIWKDHNREVIHLTMYGLPVQDVIRSIRESSKDKLVIVGGGKVPGELFRLADWNVSVTSQPHSEIGALCIFLHELFEGNELSKTFEDAEMVIVPQGRGKRVIRRSQKTE